MTTNILALTCTATSPAGKLRLSKRQAEAGPGSSLLIPDHNSPTWPPPLLGSQELVLKWPEWQYSAQPPFSVPLGHHRSILRPK